MNATVLPFPLKTPRVVTADPQPPPPPAGFKVRAFTVRTRWVKVAVPLQAGPHASFAARPERIQQNLGMDVVTASIGTHWLALDRIRDKSVDTLLIRASRELAPALGCRNPAILTLEMEETCWTRIEDLANYFQASPVELVQAYLVQRLDDLRAFDNSQRSARP